MKINIAATAGFCFGVKRAISIALDTASRGKKVCMLGDIVHNEEVVKEIENAGIKKIKKLGKGKNKILLIRAHGAPKKLIHKAKNLGYKIIDATCPMVKEIHKIVQTMEKECRKIIVIGDKKHDEVLGIIGQIKTRAIIINDLDNLPIMKLKKIKKACVVVQSTQNMEKVEKISRILKTCIKELRLFNTVCNPTRKKQDEIKKMPKENDVMIIIGSKRSANTKRLYEISSSLNPRSYWVSSEEEINAGWFRGANSVGITAGASTPDNITKEIVRCIEGLPYNGDILTRTLS